MTTTSQVMATFLANITPTTYQQTTIASRKASVVANLATAFPSSSDLPFSRAELIGSAAKGTMARPIDDIDVLAVFSNEHRAWSAYAGDSRAFLYRVRRAYDGAVTAQVGARGQAIRIFFQNNLGHVDVAPVFWLGGDVYTLPNGSGGWLNTAPTRGGGWFATRNKELGYNLAPLVRFLKKWNRAHSKRLQSFHLETMAATMFSTLGSNRQVGLESFFSWAPRYLDVTDPGGQSGALSSHLTPTARNEVLKSFISAQQRASAARQAEASGNHAESKRLWRIVLGPDFPI
jgi:Second Messenger Oligonucleotide or Dinucleotide Synthetase domain